MKRYLKVGTSLVASAAIASSMLALPAGAFAAGGLSGSVSEDTSWTVPSSKMNNTVEVDGKLNKVITTWANAWALSGPDYLGVSNSGPLNQQGGNAGSTTLSDAQNNTLLGIWASSANEVPNAYNWNYFYNLALSEKGEDTVDTAAVDVQNGSSPGFDTASGVWSPFKYRPEIIWTSNSLSASAVDTYTKYIRDGKYYTSTAADPESDDPAENADSYYIDGDESYNPEVISAKNGSAFTFTESFYELAGLVEKVEAATANNESNVTEDTVTWKNMNSLPRTTRYEASAENPVSARESALDIEKITRGSVYYTLAKIADGTVTKKKVAFLTGDPDATAGTATVATFDFVDLIGGGAENGKASFSSLVVDQLEGSNPQAVTSRGSAVTAVTTSTVTADQLAACDYVVDENGSMSTTQLKNWLYKNVSTSALKDAVKNKVEYITQTPAIMNGHNYTAEKLLWGAYNISFFYPELWPNMELVTYWYDNVYHLKSDSVATALTYGLANSSLPSDMILSELGENYSASDIDAKAVVGYNYWQTVKNTAPYSTFAADESITSTYGTLDASDTYATWATAQNVTDPIPAPTDKAASKTSAKAQTLSFASKYTKAKSYTAKKSTKKLAKAKTFSVKVSGAKTTVTYKLSSVTSSAKKYITINSKTGKVTVKKGLKRGTYKIKVQATAKATSSYKKATKTSKTITIKIK